MLTEEKFKEFYEKELLGQFAVDDINKYKTYKMQSTKKLIIILNIFALFIIINLCTDYLINNPTPIGPSIIFLLRLSIIFLLFLCIYIVLKKPSVIIPQNLKQQSIDKMSKLINPSLKYSTDNFIPLKNLLESGLYTSSIYKYRGSDYFKMGYGNSNIEFSNINIELKTSKNVGNIIQNFTKDDDNNNNIIQNFIFITSDFNKQFSGQTFILPDYIENSLGNIAKSIQSLSTLFGELVNLENSEFEKLFRVYSNDQVTSRYILSTSFMEKIILLTKKFGEDISISFIDSKLYILIPGHLDLGSLLPYDYIHDLFDYDKMLNHLKRIDMIINIVYDLKLNSHI